MGGKQKFVRGIRWLAIGALAFVLVLAGFFLVIQTQWGKDRLVDSVGALLGGKHKLHVGTVSGIVPFDFCVDRIILKDTDGPWLRADKVSIQWLPFALIKGHLHVTDFNAANIVLNRLPERGNAEGKQSEHRPSLPGSLDWLRIDRLRVDSLQLVQDEATFELAGKFMAPSADGERLSGIRLVGKKSSRTKLILSLDERSGRSTLALDVTVSGTTGALLARACNVEGVIQGSLRGEGSLGDWEGRLDAEIGHWGRTEAAIRINAGSVPGFKVRGHIEPERSRFSSHLKPMLQDTMPFYLAGRLSHKRHLSLAVLELRGSQAALVGNGSLDLRRRLWKARLEIQGEDMEFRDGLFSITLPGGGRAKGIFEGSFSGLEGNLEVDLDSFKASRFEATTVKAIFDVSGAKRTDSDGPLLRVRGKGSIGELFLKDQTTTPISSLTWSLDAEGTGEGLIRFDEIRIQGQGAEAMLSGSVKPDERRGAFLAKLNLVDPHVLGIVAPGLPLERLSGVLRGYLKEAALTGSLEGELEFSKERHRRSFGRRLNFGADIELIERRKLDVRSLTITSDAGRFTGKGAWEISPARISGTWHVEIPETGIFYPSGNPLLSGSLLAEGELAGHTNREMRLTSDVMFKRQPFHAEARFAIQGHTIDISTFTLRGPESRFAGDMEMDFGRRFVRAGVQGRIDDMAPISALLGAPVGGRLKLDINFVQSKDEGQIDFLVQGEEIATPQVQANALAAEGEVHDLSSVPKGEIELTGRGITLQGRGVLTDVDLNMRGDIESIDFSARLGGNYRRDFEIATSGRYERLGFGHQIRIHDLSGKYATVPLDLRSPARLFLKKGQIELHETSFSTGEGELSVFIALKKEDADLRLGFEDFPLEAFKDLGIANLEGRASGSLLLAGPLGDTEGHMVLDLTGFKLADHDLDELPASDLTLKAALEKGRLRTSLVLNGLSEAPFEGEIAVPMRISLQPLGYELPGSEEIAGRIKGQINLSRIQHAFAWDDQFIEGSMKVSILLAGTVKDPAVSGVAVLRNGTYENIRTYALLEGIELKGEMNRKRLSIRGHAGDGEKGHIAVYGRLDLDPERDFPFSVDLDLDQVMLLRLDHATAVADAELTLSGNFTEALLAGKVNVEQAEFRIPEHFGSQIEELDVKEIHMEKRDPLRPEPESGKGPRLLNLDVSISSRGQVYIRGRGVDSEWQGNLALKGTAVQPVVTGRISSVRGRIQLLGETFDVVRGLIAFRGRTPISPQVEIAAERSKGDITTQLSVSGPIGAPDIELFSDPSLPTDEILSRLLFGRSVTTLNVSQAAQLAYAVNTLRGGKGMGILGRTREFLRIDQLSVESTGKGLEERRLRVGKYVDDRVYLEVERGLTPQTGKATVEIEVTPKLSVETEVFENSEGGVGLKWRWDY